MKREYMAWGLALFLAAVTAAPGIATGADKPATEDSKSELVIPDNVVRAELEGVAVNVNNTTMSFVLNEHSMSWGSYTQFLDTRGQPIEKKSLRNGAEVHVSAAEIVGGYVALIIREMPR